MEEPRSLAADLLVWLRGALPWLFWGGAGGFLAAPFIDRERKMTLLVFIYSLVRSSLVGLAAGLFLVGRDYEVGDVTIAVLVAGVFADMLIFKARRRGGQALEALFTRLAVRRRNGEGGGSGGLR